MRRWRAKSYLTGGLWSLTIALLFFASNASATEADKLWDEEGEPVIEAAKHQRNYQAISDGNGGTIVVWEDEIDFDPYTIHIKAQRLDQNGDQLWNSGGNWVTNKFRSEDHSIASDGSGGVIVAWRAEVGGSYKIYAQRLDTNGVRQWKPGGDPWADVQVSTSTYGGYSPVICSNDAGGAFIGFGPRLAMVDADGELTAPGIDGIELIPGGVGSFELISDGTGGWIFIPGTGFVLVPSGAFAAWVTGGEIRAQRVHQGLAWGSSGVHVGQHTNSGNLDLARYGPGGLLISWGGADGIFPVRARVLAQKFDSNGNNLWTYNGVTVVDSNAVGGDWGIAVPSPILTDDGAGGAIVAWTDARHVSEGNAGTEVYAQRLDASGGFQWTYAGVLLPPFVVGDTAPGDQDSPVIVADGTGGAVVAYTDWGGCSGNISASRLDADGNRLWGFWKWSSLVRWDDTYTGGVCTPGRNQSVPKIVFDGSGPAPKGVIITWVDSKGGVADTEIYAQKVEIESSAPANDDCANARVIPYDGVFPGSLFRATNDGSASCGSSAGNSDVWYSYTSASAGTLQVSTCGTNDMEGEDRGMDTVLSVHPVCLGTSENEVDCNDNWTNGSDSSACSGMDEGVLRDSAVAVPMSAGETLLIRVSRFGSSKGGNFLLRVAFEPEGPPSQGDCNEDSAVTSADVTCTIIEIFNPTGKESADCNGDDMVTSADVTCTILCTFGMCP